MELDQFPAHCSLCNVSRVFKSLAVDACLIRRTGPVSYQRWRTVLSPYCTYHHHSFQPCTCSLSLLYLSLSLSLSHTHTHTRLCLWFQLGFFSLKTQWNLTGFDSEGFHIDPAIVTDIRQLDDNCCLMAETQVSLMADDNRQLWVMDGFDGKLQSWNKWKVCMLGRKTRSWMRSLWNWLNENTHFSVV